MIRIRVLVPRVPRVRGENEGMLDFPDFPDFPVLRGRMVGKDPLDPPERLLFPLREPEREMFYFMIPLQRRPPIRMRFKSTSPGSYPHRIICLRWVRVHSDGKTFLWGLERFTSATRERPWVLTLWDSPTLPVVFLLLLSMSEPQEPGGFSSRGSREEQVWCLNRWTRRESRPGPPIPSPRP